MQALAGFVPRRPPLLGRPLTKGSSMHKTITCIRCGTTAIRTGRNQKYCEDCRKVRMRERSYMHRVKTGSIKLPGVGSGGAQERGSKHHSWKTGIGSYTKAKRASCERCGGTRNLCVHHKDRDRSNNAPDNLETLCRSCHAKEHRCGDNFSRGKPHKAPAQRDHLGRFVKHK